MAARPICVGIKADGAQCNKVAQVGNTRCATHINTLNRNGPHSTAVKELEYRQKAIFNRIRDEELARIELIQDFTIQDRMNADLTHRLHILRLEHNHQVDLLIRAQEDEIRRTGVDPDAEARQRRHEELIRRNREQAERQRERVAEFQAIVAQAAQAAGPAAQAVRPVGNLPIGELQHFARDNQNVHRERTVNATKEMVTLILTIPVPVEYRWNVSECSKTPGEIAMTCHLTPKAAWQMFSKYCQDESIYELGKGIYGKVLDGVWQYILTSPDKTDLCRVLKQEMEDNIGMCAQGNLSRLCNILAGYLEGIGSQESIAEVMGRLLPKLMEIENIDTRLTEACKILKENKVPFSQWKSWVEPLLGDQDVELTVGFLYNERQEVTGIIAVVG